MYPERDYKKKSCLWQFIWHVMSCLLDELFFMGMILSWRSVGVSDHKSYCNFVGIFGANCDSKNRNFQIDRLKIRKKIYTSFKQELLLEISIFSHFLNYFQSHSWKNGNSTDFQFFSSSIICKRSAKMTNLSVIFPFSVSLQFFQRHKKI